MNPFLYVTPELVFYAVCFGLILGLLYLLSCFWPPDSPWSPWWRTDVREGKHAIELGKISKDDVVYELGSGDGEFICLVARNYAKRAVGIEIDPARHLIARFRKFINRIPDNKLKLERKNFFDLDVSSATVLYIYLVPRALDKLLPKLKKELKPGTRVISYRFEFRKIKPKAKVQGERHPFFLYTI